MSQKKQISNREWKAMDAEARRKWCEEANIPQTEIEALLAGEKPPKIETSSAPVKKKGGRKQPDLLEGGGPGVGPQARIQEIEDAAEDYCTTRDARMSLTKEEVKKRDFLMAVVQKHKLTTYKYDRKLVVIEPADTTPKISVKELKKDTVTVGADDLQEEQE